MKNKRINYIFQAMLLVVVFTMASGVEAAVYFSDSLESGDLSHTEGGVSWGGSNASAAGGDEVSVSTERARPGGTHSIKFKFTGNADPNDDAWAEQRMNLGSHKTEFWIQYYLYLPNNYQHRDPGGNNNKFIAIYGSPYSTKYFEVNYSTRSVNGSDSRFDTHYYHLGIEQSILHYSNPTFTDAHRGQWNKINVHLKVPTGDVADGVFELSVNDSVVASETSLNSYGGAGENYFDELYLLGWANSGFDVDTILYIDDIEISDTPPEPDGQAPILAEVTPIPTLTTDHTPNYTFSSTEPGTITYTGDCSSSTTSASSGSNTITLNALSNGTYSNCTINVTDSSNNTSIPLSINTFTIDTSTASSIRADVDQNTTVNAIDALLTLRNSLGLSMSSTNWQASGTTGDVNCDSNSNSTDALLILRSSLGLEMSGTRWCD